MNQHGDGKPEPADPDDALRRLELELMRERTIRKQAGTPYRALRTMSFLFLFAIIVGALLAFYYIFFAGGLDELRARSGPNPAPATQSTPKP